MKDEFEAGRKRLAATPDGPAKNISIRAYADSRYKPETAAQWAMTLPPGKDRDETLKRIFGNWTKEGAAAKEAFLKSHGINLRRGD